MLPLNTSVLTQLATEAQLNRVCNYVGKVDVLDNETAVVEAIDNAEENKTADCDKIQATQTIAITMSMWQRLSTTMSTVAVWWMTT